MSLVEADNDDGDSIGGIVATVRRFRFFTKWYLGTYGNMDFENHTQHYIHYADDAVLITRNPDNLKQLLRKLDLYRELNRLQANKLAKLMVYMEPLKKIQVEGYGMFAEPEILFGNLDELCCVTYAFCKDFINLIMKNMNSGDILPTGILVTLFQRSSKTMSLTQAYHRYALNYINALNYLETLRRQIEFIEFEKWCTRDPRCNKLQLTDLLVAPVQHIMKTPLILKDIEARTLNPEEKKAVTEILDTEESSIRELDDKMKWLKNFERLLEIQRSIMWPSVVENDPKSFIPDFLKSILCKQPCERLIVSPRRQIIMEGNLQLIEGGKALDMFVILFDDMLLITSTTKKKFLVKKKSSITENWASSSSRQSGSENSLKYVVYKQPLSLDRFLIYDISASDAATNNLKHAMTLVSLNRFQQIVCVYTFQAPSDSAKTSWITKINDTVERWKRMLQNTVFRTPQSNNEEKEGEKETNKKSSENNTASSN
ncbi:Pleckstrin y domain-containing family G member 7 [Nymphon striatum]|nr:Pleckstrin y domain-containing family G member 7 [Nymphon striatum]